MNLFRFLVLCLVGWLIGRMLRRIGKPTQPKQAQTTERFEAMARCSTCGVHLPQRELSSAGRCRNCDAQR